MWVRERGVGSQKMGEGWWLCKQLEMWSLNRGMGEGNEVTEGSLQESVAG